MLKLFKKKQNIAPKTDDFKYAIGAILTKFDIKSFDSLLFVGTVNQSALWFFEKSGVWADCISDGTDSERVHYLKHADLNSLPSYEFVVFANDFSAVTKDGADKTVSSLLTENGRLILISTDTPLPDNVKTLLPSVAFDVETSGEIKVLSATKRKN